MDRIHQFEILEPQTPDLGGIVYKARDTKSGKVVALRKLKPFGVETEELNSEQIVAYQVAVERLTKIHNPWMRPVLAGGCDPADGMPYYVSDWIDATPVQSLLDEGPLSKEHAAKLVCKALEVSDLLTGLLAEEAIWVETDIAAISVLPGDGAPDFRFWVSPTLGLTRYKDKRGLVAIVDLTEEIIGKSAEDESALHADSLETWLKWLKASAGKTATIHEAREVLAASMGVEPPAPLEQLVEDAKAQGNLLSRLPNLPLSKLARPKMPLFIILCVLLVVEAFIGFALVQYISSSHEEDVDRINQDYEHIDDFLDMDDTRR